MANTDNNNENRILANKLSRKRRRTPEEELLLRQTRRDIHTDMELLVDDHFDYLLYERTWRFAQSGTPITNIKVNGKSTSGTLAQAVWAANAGMSLEDVVAAKTKVNRLNEDITHNGDYRIGVLTLDSANLMQQRNKVELADVPKQYWGLSYCPETLMWYARVRINKENVHWTSTKFSSIGPALDVLTFAQKNKVGLSQIGVRTIEHMVKGDLEQMEVDVFSMLNKYDRSVSSLILQGDWCLPEGLEVPTDNIINNLMTNSRRAWASKLPDDNDGLDLGGLPDPADVFSPELQAEFKAKFAAITDKHWQKLIKEVVTKLTKHWDDFIRNADDPHRWCNGSIQRLLDETEQFHSKYYRG